MQTLILALIATSANAADLSIRGACPGVVDLEITGTPGGRFAVFTASTPGSTMLGGGPCADTRIDLDAPNRFGPISDADGDGVINVSPSLSGRFCSNSFQILDLATCEVSDVETLGSGAVLEFPRASTATWSTFASSTVGASEGMGFYFVAGSYAEDTYTDTDLTSLTSLDLNIDMYDSTSGCAIGEVYRFAVTVNGFDAGEYSWEGGRGGGATFAVVDSYAFPPIAGAGDGDDYTLRIEALDTVCPGGSSWSWMSGGVTTLR